MATVVLQDVSKAYGDFQAVQPTSLSISDGEFVVLLGPSGSGKTTLLRMIAGLEEITDGRLLFDGKIVNDTAPRHRNVAMVFQNYALYAHMTCFENIAFNLRVRKLPDRQIQERVASVADLLGIANLLQKLPYMLSGGQRQRVAMGRALVRDPAIFLFDEPLSNLDASLRLQLRTEIRSIHERLRTTSVYVTHDQSEALALADRVVVMRTGRVEQEGPPLAVYDRPINSFVAGFLGSPPMNFFRGAITSAGFVTDHGQRLPLPNDVGDDLGRRLIYGIRPDQISLSSNQDGIPMALSVVEPLGSGTELHGSIGPDPVSVVLNRRENLTPNTTLFLQPDLSSVHLFHETDGSRYKTANS